MNRTLALFALALLLAACASHPPVPAVPVPEPEVEEAVAELEVIEPEIPLAERIHAPFAVQSSGQPAPRERRRMSVVLDTTAAPAAERLAAAEAQVDTATEGNGAPATEPEPRETPPAAARDAAPAATPPPAPRPATARAQPREHRVAPGETLMAIARRYGVSYTALLNSNPGMDPDRLRPDQVIRVPAASTPPAAPAASRPATTATPAPARTPPAATRRTHTVAQGETLWGIARRYGVTVEQIRTANRMQDDTVRIGQTLAIPNG